MANLYDLDITNALNDVYETGFCKIEWRKINRWFGAKRISSRVWGELEGRWNDIDAEREKAGWRLGYLDWHHLAHLTLVCLDPEGTSQEKASFKPISSLAKSAPKDD